MWLDGPFEETDERGRQTRTTEARGALNAHMNPSRDFASRRGGLTAFGGSEGRRRR
jgi:hypothetical protein